MTSQTESSIEQLSEDNENSADEPMEVADQQPIASTSTQTNSEEARDNCGNFTDSLYCDPTKKKDANQFKLQSISSASHKPSNDKLSKPESVINISLPLTTEQTDLVSQQTLDRESSKYRNGEKLTGLQILYSICN